MSFEQKKYFESGVRYERERIFKLLNSAAADFEFSKVVAIQEGHTSTANDLERKLILLSELKNQIKGGQK